jgi:hypothetical protein
MKINIKFKVRDRVLETYISNPRPSVKSLTKIIEVIAGTPNLFKVELINESRIQT